MSIVEWTEQTMEGLYVIQNVSFENVGNGLVLAARISTVIAARTGNGCSSR